ncbi:MAG: HAD-IIB family hydrolase [Candidatus Merdivicinus sp.]|jgi:HAD superfamily hydrolase (TIGR01484 family)
MRPIEELSATQASKIRIILHDIDDTITNNGKLTAEAYTALWRLHDTGFRVIPVTGRPAGWCDMAIRQWPIDAIVGENGAFVYYWKDGKPEMFRHPSIPAESVADKLDAVRKACLAGVPGCRIAKDQHFRMYDLAVDFREDEPKLPLEAGDRIREIAESMGAVAKVSSIHVNCWYGNYDKLSMTRLFLREIYGIEDPEECVMFFGDSANDEPMFRELPLSCGVENVEPFLSRMQYHPAYLAEGEGGYGFARAADFLIQQRLGNCIGKE